MKQSNFIIALSVFCMCLMGSLLLTSCSKDDEKGGGDLSGKTLKYYVAEFDDSAGQIYETTERIIFNSTSECEVKRHGYDWVYYDEWEKDYWSDNYSTTYTYDGNRLVVKGYVLMWNGSRVDKTFINKGGYFEGDGGEEFFFE